MSFLSEAAAILLKLGAMICITGCSSHLRFGFGSSCYHQVFYVVQGQKLFFGAFVEATVIQALAS